MYPYRIAALFLFVGTGLANEQASVSALLEDDECQQGVGSCGLNAIQVRSGQGSEDLEESLEDESAELSDDGINMAELDAQLNETGRIMTLYHVTSPRIGHMILKSGFKSGHAGWCGGGIYFATSAAATRWKAVGYQSHTGFLIEAKVDVGRVKHKGQLCYTSRSCILRHNSFHGHISCLSRANMGHHVQSEGYNSIIFNPGDGTEVVIWNPHQVKSMRHIR